MAGLLPSLRPGTARPEPIDPPSKKASWSLLGSLVGLGVVVAFLFTGFTGGPYERTAMFAGLVVVGILQLTLVAWIGVGIYCLRLMRPKERPCEACGSIIPLERPTGPVICPRCRLRHLRPDEAKKANARVIGVILILAGILGSSRSSSRAPADRAPA